MKNLLIGLVCLLLWPAWADAQADANSKQVLAQWVMNYYKHPDPMAVPDKVRKLSQAGILTTDRPEANTMFLSRIMASNPTLIAGWMDGWKDLPEQDFAVLLAATSMSQTDAGKRWLKENGHGELAIKSGHPLVTGEGMVLEPYHLDMLWEWYFATGDAAPVKQIVGKYQLLDADPGDEDLPRKPVPGGDRATYLRQAIGGSAVWSSASLATTHDRLLKILKEIQDDPQLPARAGAWLKRAVAIAERERAKATLAE